MCHGSTACCFVTAVFYLCDFRVLVFRFLAWCNCVASTKYTSVSELYGAGCITDADAVIANSNCIIHPHTPEDNPAAGVLQDKFRSETRSDGRNGYRTYTPIQVPLRVSDGQLNIPFSHITTWKGITGNPLLWALTLCPCTAYPCLLDWLVLIACIVFRRS